MAVVEVNGTEVFGNNHEKLTDMMVSSTTKVELLLAKPKRMRGVEGSIVDGEFVPAGAATDAPVPENDNKEGAASEKAKSSCACVVM